MNSKQITLFPEERLLFIINDNVIDGTTRFQKYGFLLFKQYQKELAELKISYPDFNFYNDWKSYCFGPYSEELDHDIQSCVKNGILEEYVMEGKTNYKVYQLTLKGRVKWCKIFWNTTDEVIKINDKIRHLQHIKLIELLKQIHEKYPKFHTS